MLLSTVVGKTEQATRQSLAVVVDVQDSDDEVLLSVLLWSVEDDEGSSSSSSSSSSFSVSVP